MRTNCRRNFHPSCCRLAGNAAALTNPLPAICGKSGFETDWLPGTEAGGFEPPHWSPHVVVSEALSWEPDAVILHVRKLWG